MACVRSKSKTTQQDPDWWKTDKFLRSLGWRIHKRRGEQEPIWIREGKELFQYEILDKWAQAQCDGK